MKKKKWYGFVYGEGSDLHPEDGGRMLLQKTSNILPDYIASCHKRQKS
jgi:hypothetical protein